MIAAGLCRTGGASLIIASDLMEFRRNKALEMGADIAVDPRSEDIYKIVMDKTDNCGVDVLLEISGNPKALNDGLRCLTPGGRVSLLGLFDDDISLDVNRGIVFKGARVYGITGRKMFSTWFTTRNLLASKRINIEPVITHRLALDEVAKGMELMHSGQSGKIILVP
jgi:threonine 3-dehydrogenase